MAIAGESLKPFSARRVDPARFAAGQRELFDGLQLRIGASSTVHLVAWREWLNGLQLPAPACGQGWAGLGAAGELRPTTSFVTCRRCERLLGGPASNEQRALFELPFPRAPRV
ncbi:MAG: hypothetical protein ABS81_08215 [Pseudonocardia sp. SCN 72-86]|nr:MAG: hypothetical protein ABS81_08215 [Pseudonocardia sp. SCN 72-86]